ncbi:MAG: hypothetical protein U9N30_03420, partial [Campylobacterota bacterium]|nr:hypothetical protein [Campylobacterota bacterium]
MYFKLFSNMLYDFIFSQVCRRRTPHITGSKKQSEERAALFAVRVHVIVIHFSTISVKYNTNITA